MTMSNVNFFSSIYVEDLTRHPLELDYHIVEAASKGDRAYGRGITVFFGNSPNMLALLADASFILERNNDIVPMMVSKKKTDGEIIHPGRRRKEDPVIQFIIDDTMKFDDTLPDKASKSSLLECMSNERLVPLKAKGMRVDYCKSNNVPAYAKLSEYFPEMPAPKNKFGIGFRVNNPKYCCIYQPFSNPPGKTISSRFRSSYSEYTWRFFTMPVFYDNEGTWNAQAIDFISKGNDINDDVSLIEYCNNKLHDNPQKAITHLKRGAKRAFNLIDAMTSDVGAVESAVLDDGVPIEMRKKYVKPLLCECRKMINENSGRAETVIGVYNKVHGDNITVDDLREGVGVRYF